MKKLILATLILSSVSSFAKLTVFSNLEATKLILNDETVMSKILKKSETNTLDAVKVESDKFNEFTVTVTTSTEEAVCSTAVKVKAQKVQAEIPGGAKITTNKLVVTKIETSECMSK